MKIEEEVNKVVRDYARHELFEADKEVAAIDHGKGCRCRLCVQNAVNRWNFFAWLLGSNRKHLKAKPGQRGYTISMEDDESGSI